MVSGPNVSQPFVVYVSFGRPTGCSASIVRPIAGFSKPFLHILVGNDPNLVLAEIFITSSVIEVVVRVEQHLYHSRADLGDGFRQIAGSRGISPVDHQEAIRPDDEADISTVARKCDDAIADLCR
jgi:hypothetical protein